MGVYHGKHVIEDLLEGSVTLTVQQLILSFERISHEFIPDRAVIR